MAPRKPVFPVPLFGVWVCGKEQQALHPGFPYGDGTDLELLLLHPAVHGHVETSV